MVVFCPHCGNVLFVEHAATMRYYCPTCPYVRALTKKISHQLPLKKKVVDDILGGAAAWETAEPVLCEKCGGHEAFFMQIQIRSADEPMTTFYRCSNLKCNFIWREG